MDATGEAHEYRDLGGPKALWRIPDGPALAFSPPARLQIPDIGVDAATMRVGRNGDGSVQVPPFSAAAKAGWYEHGPAPGSRGPAVVLGHYDDTAGPAVFYKLKRLKPGAVVKVVRKDRSVALFSVDAVEQVRKFEFPRSRVYGEVRYAGLRLVTCGGSYNGAEHSYRDNVIVYAHLSGER
ncbi:class F sortase [Actinomadura sp. PM05-2]|uniref:Class F sortase n=2 Tax=Actinomadura parmotrematis TaxID=2864039 RepID=A0ABS7G683_9ACTN|nr:class F sortase [Actinomadura parmotrematis]